MVAIYDFLFTFFYAPLEQILSFNSRPLSEERKKNDSVACPESVSIPA